MEKVQLDTEFIKLDQLLKLVGAVGSGSDAKILISEGLVRVNGQPEYQRGKKIRKNDIIEIENDKYLIE